jgi:hypothetical protein
VISQREKIRQLNAFLDRFSALSNVVTPTYSRFLYDYEKAKNRFINQERINLDTLNIFDVLGFGRDEKCHSRVLAWLLDRRDEIGSHYQGSKFFEIFCAKLNLPREYATTTYEVHRECQGKFSTIDIEIVKPAKFIIHIENKVGATEGHDQLERESRDLMRKQDEYGIATNHVHGYYLTPYGVPPKKRSPFKPLSWSVIHACLSSFTSDKTPFKLGWFLDQYSSTIFSHVLRRSE